MSVLHPTHTLTALLPQYVSRFSCIGATCEDNCCTGWRVSIDKKTFNAYRQSNHPELAPHFKKDVNRQRSQASDAHYARIILKPDTGACPFMEEHLCSIQKELTESYLSDTCHGYPRHTHHFAGIYEQSLSLSCPEAARRALLDADAFDFIEGKIAVRPSVIKVIKSPQGLSPDLMNEVRIFCLQLMRTEKLEIWQRLAVLGLFCEQLTEILTRSAHAEVPELLENFTRMVENGLVLDALADLAPHHEAQAWILGFFWWSKPKVTLSANQRQIVDAVTQGLNMDAEISAKPNEKIIASYQQGIARLPEALQAAPRLLEHYLLNEIFQQVFPFQNATPYENYLKLISRFGLVRLMLAGLCNREGPLPDAKTLVQTVQVFYRLFQHDLNFAAQVNNALSNSGWSKLEKIYGFLRT